MRIAVRRAAALVTVGLIAASGLVTAPVASAATPIPVAKVSVSATTLTVGQTLKVTVSGLSKNRGARVFWGDGTGSTWVAPTTCTNYQATYSPDQCKRTVSHVYKSAKVFSLRAEQPAGTVIYRKSITVNPVPTTGGGTTTGGTTGGTTTGGTTVTPAAWETDMLNQVNSLRASVGLSPLELCAPLRNAAQKHATDMATNNFFSHYSLDGRTPGQRINAEGYFGGWAENIAAGNSGVTATMNQWINSPGHYANLTNGMYTHVGFGQGVNPGSAYGYYWVQNFGYGGTC